jgi:hypothetical protein
VFIKVCLSKKELVHYGKIKCDVVYFGPRIGCSYVKYVYVFNAFYYFLILYVLRLWYLLNSTLGKYIYVISLAFIKQQFSWI